MWKKKFNKAKHIEDFLDLSCGKLNFFLQQRAILVGGNHQSDLAARALVALNKTSPLNVQKTVQRIYDMNTAILLVD